MDHTLLRQMADEAAEMVDDVVRMGDDVAAKGHVEGQAQVEVVDDVEAKRMKKAVAAEGKLEEDLCARRMGLAHCDILKLKY
jgi:hypothetical protein